MTTRRAASKHINYNENENYDEEEDAAGSDDFEGEPRATSSGPRSSGRNRRKSQVLREYQGDDDDDEEEELIAPKRTTSASKLKLVLKPKTEVQASTLTRSSARHSTGAGNEDENEDDADGGAAENGDYAPEPVDHDSQDNTRRTRNRAVNYVVDVPSDSDDGVVRPGRGTGKGKAKGPSNSGLDKDGDDDYDDDDNDDDAEYGSRPRRKFKTKTETQNKRFSGMAARSKARRNKDTDDDFVGGSEDSADEEDLNLNDDDSDDIQDIQSSQQGGYGLRQRKKVDYRVPTVDKNGNLIFPKGVDPSTFSSTLFPRPGPTTFVDDTPKKRPPRKNGWNGLPSKMSGKEYEKLFGDGLDSSDDDVPASRRVLGAGLGGGAMLGGLPSSISGLLGGAGGLGAFGGAATAHGAADKDAHLGRIKPGKDGLADVDPFGPNMQVDFSSIGGLDSHVQQLKEMVSLPLLYPEVFQRFKITPPRGVLFHGPPGTGKTLVARALAASCSTEGQQISFFMRKGADCLSKWVGEAERQLRLLFEEAKNSQPSIIFFDEIDGLAPVRSSKQDQIHASIVSTLLALMDGMDGRGQVVVIGATNRPDSVDPALRRPGRFDREFYFPLPDKKARRAILDIHTRGWEPPLPNEFKDRLAEVTKGYGGADMRALCTEAALNAIQRRYPQVYTTNERLLLQPETIRVDAKDFMMSVNKVVPSSKRAGGGSAAALPEHLQPLLEHTVSEASRVLDLMMPPTSKRNALEEAMYEDEAPMASSSGAADARAQDGGFGRELLLQSFEALRVFKPRVLIYGDEGMGQSVVGAAILHHLEGYHVQPLDIATLLGDSTRTPEAAIIQIFQEAKRHKPSILYIPGLIHWASSVPEGVKTTLKSLLDGLAPSDPVMLLAIAEGPLDELRGDVRSWFGFLPDNKVEIMRPTAEQRQAFFSDLLAHASRPPTEFPDGVPRRKRVLEDLPKAPPKAEKPPSKAELEQLQQQDERTLEHLKFRLSPVLAELRKKFKRFCRDARLEYNLQNLMSRFAYKPPSGGKVVVHLVYDQPIKGRGARLVSPAKVRTEPLPELLPAVNGTATDLASTGEPAVEGDGAGISISSPTKLGAVEADVSMADVSSQPGPSQGLAPTLSLTGPDGPPLTPSRPPQTLDTLQVPSQYQPSVELGPPEAHKRDMTIWLISLDKMHTWLFNGHYLTAEEFLDDIQKLISNAEEAAEVDEDRVNKAYELRTLALILVEQFVDPAFRVECTKMAKRVREREAQAKAEKKREASAADRANGLIASGSNIAPPTTSDSNASPLKRMRDQDDVGSSNLLGSQDGDSSQKRQRVTPPPGGSSQSPFAPGPRPPVIGATPHRSPFKNLEAQEEARRGAAASTHQNGPMGMNSLLNGSNVPARSSPTKSSSTAVAAPSMHFHIDQNALASLARHMVHVSEEFTIDQLEQLRATAFNVVWRRRSDWDRTALLQELRGLSDRVAHAIREERAVISR